jgi:large subunit ribosomal protein L22
MTQKLAVASLESVKSSPLKVMRVTKNITGRPVSEALKLLQFSNLKLAPIVRALVYSAMANAENNHNMDVDNLYVKEVDVGRAFALRRFATRGRGKSSRILKTFSKIRVILAEKLPEKKAEKKQKKGE